MKRKYNFSSKQKKDLILFFEGKISYEKASQSLDISKQGVYSVVTNLVKDMVEDGLLDISTPITKY